MKKSTLTVTFKGHTRVFTASAPEWLKDENERHYWITNYQEMCASDWKAELSKDYEQWERHTINAMARNKILRRIAEKYL